MAAFGIGTNVTQTSAGEIQGRQINIACKTWFTANGSASPLSIKFEGDDGIIQSISDICVLCVFFARPFCRKMQKVFVGCCTYIL